MRPPDGQPSEWFTLWQPITGAPAGFLPCSFFTSLYALGGHVENDLIYDVGMHNGDDTAFYVRQGYRVVAVEADPAQAEAGRRRFAAEIAKGQVHIVEAAIGPNHGQASFWISSNPEYSSFDRQSAERWDNTSREIQVLCRPMEDILDHFGVPYYLKIDIEKADRFCMEALDRSDLPEFVSFEKGDLNDLFFMEALGYSRFKMIAQEDFCQMHYDPGWTIKVSQRLEKIRGRVLRKLNDRAPETASGEHYAYGSSGPFGESTDGPWRQVGEVAFTWLAFDFGHTGDPDPVRNDWFDVHCAR